MVIRQPFQGRQTALHPVDGIEICKKDQQTPVMDLPGSRDAQLLEIRLQIISLLTIKRLADAIQLQPGGYLLLSTLRLYQRKSVIRLYLLFSE